MSRNAPRLLAGLAALILPAGCGAGDGLDRRAIAGEVTLDGRPVEAGFLLFDPADNRSGTAVGAAVRRGRFAVDRRQGPVPGRYVVRVYASSGVQEKAPPGSSSRAPRPLVDLVPDRYNEKSVLRATVTSDGDNTFRFPMTSGPSPAHPGAPK